MNACLRSSTSERAISASGSARDIEVKNCSFNGPRIQLHSTSDTYGPTRWKIHHNTFNLVQYGYGISLTRAGAIDIFNNQFALNEGTAAIYDVTSLLGTPQRSRIYNNVIAGKPRTGGTGYGIRVEYNWDVDHNTVLLEDNNNNSAAFCIYVNGILGRHVELRNNICVNEGTGTALAVFANLKGFDWLSERNIYYTTSTANGIFYSTVESSYYSSLGSWQQATGKDTTSMVVDPKLVGGGSLPDRLKLLKGSPAAAAATNTRSYITTDFAGTTRPSPASIGAFEGKPKIPPSTFVAFGSGCAGTFNNVPRIGYTGELKLGSTDFAVTLSNALGGARTIFALGVSNTRIGSVSLPFPFGGGCNLLTSSDVLLQLTASGSGPGNGTASVKFRIPDKQGLKGARFHFQWGVVDPAAKGIGLAFSDGASVTL